MIGHTAAAYRVLGRRLRHAHIPARWWLDALDHEARQRAPLWETATHWHWLDAAAWVASHQPRVMALLTGYRDFRDRLHSVPVGEGACRTVLQMHVRERAVTAAERQLRAWCRAGAIEALSIETGLPVSVADWHGGREPAQSDMPFVLLPADTLRHLSPVDPASSILRVVEAGQGGTPPRKPPSAAELTEWAKRVGNVPRDHIDADYLARTWEHPNPAKRPTILEARAALDAAHGKRSRGRERKSNQIG